MTTASNSDARKRLAARNTAPDTAGLRANAGPWRHDDGTMCPTHYASTPRATQGFPWWCTEHQQYVHATAHPDPTPEPEHRLTASNCRDSRAQGAPISSGNVCPACPATVSDPAALTDAEWRSLVAEWPTLAAPPKNSPVIHVFERIIAARVAEAVEQERAARLALVAKIEALVKEAEAGEGIVLYPGHHAYFTVETGLLRALLDDTKATS